MTTPPPEAVFAALDATWPPLSQARSGPFQVRNGDGGGKRVSASVAHGPVHDTDIDLADAAMRNHGQTPLYMIRDRDQALDDILEKRGYAITDPTVIYAARTGDIARTFPITTIIPAWPPLAIQAEIWAAGGVDANRVRVMERAIRPKTTILGRTRDTPGGTVFVAVHDEIAMLHALEVRPQERKKGLGETLVRAAAHWAALQGAAWLTLAVTRANAAANALYVRIGMSPVAGYHYRLAPQVAA